MKEVAKHYFSHPSVWTYIFIGAGVLSLCLHFGFLQQYYYLAFLPIVIAPFFEWFAHKYILHAQIGNVTEVASKDYPDVKIGDKITVNYHKKDIAMEVLELKIIV
jgi:uncharacterized membrane protein